MRAFELRLALAIAQDSTVDLSAEWNNPILFGFGLPDFEECHVSLKVVAATLRWQCQCFDGSWDWKQFNEDRRHYLRKEIQIVDLHDTALRQWLFQFVQERLQIAA